MNQIENYRKAYETLQQRKKHLDIISMIADAKSVEDIKSYANETGVSYINALERWVSDVQYICQYALQRSKNETA